MTSAIKTRGRLVLGAGCVLWIGAMTGCGAEGAPDPAAASVHALTIPQPGETIVIDFSNDALGNPLPRGTILGEQLAAAGIHFTGGYVLGDLTTDFPDYHLTPPNNLVCTPDAAVHRPTVVSWVDGRCGEGHQPAADVPFGITLDFAACWVTVWGYSLADSSPAIVPGTVGIRGYDASNVLKGAWNSKDIIPSYQLQPDAMGNPVWASPGGGIVSLPPSMSRFPTVAPDPTLDVHRVEITNRGLGAYDTVTFIRCGGGAGGGGAGGGGAGGGGAGGGGVGGSSVIGGTGGMAAGAGGGGATPVGGAIGSTGGVPVGSGGTTAAGGRGGTPGVAGAIGTGLGGNGGATGGAPAGGGRGGGATPADNGGITGTAGMGGNAAGGSGTSATGTGGAGTGGASPGAGTGGSAAGGRGGSPGAAGAAGTAGVPSGGAGGTHTGNHDAPGCSAGGNADSGGSPGAALAVAATILALRRRRPT